MKIPTDKKNEVSIFYKIEVTSSESIVGSTVKVGHLANGMSSKKE